MRRAWAVWLTMLAAAPVAGQQRWRDETPGHAAQLALAIAAFDDNITASPVVTLAARARYALGDKLALTAELPMARAELEAGLSGTAVGNPWIGIQHRAANGLQLELGARLSLWSPTTQQQSLPFGYGQLVDFDRREAWFVRASAVRAVVHFGQLPAQGSFVNVKAGLLGFAVSGGGGDGELLALYGGRAGIVSGRWLAWLGVIGQGIVTESGLGLSDRTMHQGEVAVATRVHRWQLELAMRRFVGESFASNMPFVAHLSMGFVP